MYILRTHRCHASVFLHACLHAWASLNVCVCVCVCLCVFIFSWCVSIVFCVFLLVNVCMHTCVAHV